MDPNTPQSMPTTGLPPLYHPARSTPPHQTGRSTSSLRYMPIYISPGTSSWGTGQREVQLPTGMLVPHALPASDVQGWLQRCTPTWPQLLRHGLWQALLQGGKHSGGSVIRFCTFLITVVNCVHGSLEMLSQSQLFLLSSLFAITNRSTARVLSWYAIKLNDLTNHKMFIVSSNNTCVLSSNNTCVIF